MQKETGDRGGRRKEGEEGKREYRCVPVIRLGGSRSLTSTGGHWTGARSRRKIRRVLQPEGGARKEEKEQTPP